MKDLAIVRTLLASLALGICACGTLIGCTLHSGNGQDPNAVTHPDAGVHSGSESSDSGAVDDASSIGSDQ